MYIVLMIYYYPWIHHPWYPFDDGGAKPKLQAGWTVVHFSACTEDPELLT